MRPARLLDNLPEGVVAHPPGELHVVAEAGQAGGDVELGPHDGTAVDGRRPQGVTVGGDKRHERFAERDRVHPTSLRPGEAKTAELGLLHLVARHVGGELNALVTAGPPPDEATCGSSSR